MKKTVQSIKTKVGLFAIIVAATALGGLTTAVVSASIPDSGGTIHGCYRNSAGLFDSKGTLRVINTDTGESCTSQETGLNWSQSSDQQAYAHFTGGSGNGIWDTARSKNITSVSFVSASSGYGACITASFEPKNITVSGAASSPTPVAVRNTGLNPENNGWSSADANTACGTTGNAFFTGFGGSASIFVDLTE